MPTLEFIEPTLNGQASICKYKGRKYLNLRVLRDGRKYTHISLNTEKLDQAHKNALDAYVKVMSTPPPIVTGKHEYIFDHLLRLLS